MRPLAFSEEIGESRYSQTIPSQQCNNLSNGLAQDFLMYETDMISEEETDNLRKRDDYSYLSALMPVGTSVSRMGVFRIRIRRHRVAASSLKLGLYIIS